MCLVYGEDASGVEILPKKEVDLHYCIYVCGSVRVDGGKQSRALMPIVLCASGMRGHGGDPEQTNGRDEPSKRARLTRTTGYDSIKRVENTSCVTVSLGYASICFKVTLQRCA